MVEVDLNKLIKAVIRRWAIISIVVFLVIAAVSLYYYITVPDEFTSTTILYVLNQQNEDNVTYSDLTGSSLLINDYRELITSRKVTGMAAKSLGLESLKDYKISVKSVKDTRFIEIAVTGESAHMAANVAAELANNFAIVIVDVMNVDNVSIIDEAEVPKLPSGPRRNRNIAIAALAAFVVSVSAIMAAELLNNKLKTAQDIEQQLKLSVFAQIPMVNENIKS